jgi:hypothetical protein
MKRIIYLLILGLALVSTAKAQGVGFDTKNKSIFSYYTSDNNIAIQTSSSMPVSIYKTWTADSVPKYYLARKWLKGRPAGADTVPTVTKQHLWALQGAMLTDGGNSYASFKKIRPGIGLAFGYQNSINAVSHLDVTGGAWTWGVNGIFDLNNIDLYNTNTNQEGNKLPVTYGLEANVNHLFPHSNTAKFYWLLSVTASVYHTWNDDELLSYQNVDAATITNNIVAFDSFRGRYGDFKNNITNGRFSAATPLYWWYLNLIPFAELNTYSNNQSDYHLGAFMLVLPEKITATHYSIPTSLGVGVDWTHAKGGFAGADFIITGTFKFK